MEFKEIKYENPLTLEIGKSPDSDLIEAANSYMFSNETEMPGKLVLLDGAIITKKEDMKVPLYTYLYDRGIYHRKLISVPTKIKFRTLTGTAYILDKHKYGIHLKRDPGGIYSFSLEHANNVDVWFCNNDYFAVL